MPNPGLMERDRVEVTLDHHRLARRLDVAARLLEAEQKRSLVVDGRLRRVEVLGFVQGREGPGAETDHLAPRLDEGNDQPVAEPVEQRAAPAVAATGEAGLDQDFVRKTPVQSPRKIFPARGRDAEPERALGLTPDAALLEVGSRRAAGAGVGEPLLVGLGRRRQRLDQGGARAPARGASLRHRNPGAAAELLHRFDEADLLRLHHEPEHVAARLAAEAVVELTLGMDRERRGLFTVKRTQAHEVPADALERHRLGDDLDDVARDANPFHPFVAGASGHDRVHLSFATVTPRPPSPTSPNRMPATCTWARRCRSTAARSTPFPMPWITLSSDSPPSTHRSRA